MSAYLGGVDGSIRASTDGDSPRQQVGNFGTGVASLTAGPRAAGSAIGADRTVRSSPDGGRHWTIRITCESARMTRARSLARHHPSNAT